MGTYVVVELFADYRVVLVGRVAVHKLADPRRGGDQRPVGALADKVDVVVEPGAYRRVEVQRIEEAVHKRHEAGQRVAARAAEELRKSKLTDAARRVRILERGPRVAEEELLGMNGVAQLRALHIHIHLGQRHIQVQVEVQHGA